jgi:hypothetical protein
MTTPFKNIHSQRRYWMFVKMKTVRQKQDIAKTN